MPGDIRLGRGVVPIEADDTGLREDIRAKVKAAGAGESIKVPVKADTSGFYRDAQGRLRDEKGKFVKDGERIGDEVGAAAGKKAGSAFTKHMKTGLGRFDFLSKLDFLPGVQPQLLAVAAAAMPAAAGLLAVGSSLGLAASSAAAFIPAGIGLVAAGGAIGLAFWGVGDAVKASAEGSEQYQEALDKLTPSGREFTRTIVGMKDELRTLRETAASATLPGFTAALRSAKSLIPDVNRYLADMGSQVGRTAAEVGEFVASPMFRGQLGYIMHNNALAASAFADSATPLATILANVAQAASPLVARFAMAWANGTRLVSNWLEIRYLSGQLAAFFRLAGDEMAKWWNITTNFLVGIIGLFAAANKQGQGFSSSLEDISEKFRSWGTSERARTQVQRLFEILGSIDVGRILAVASAVGAIGLAAKAFTLGEGLASGVAMLAGLGPIGLTVAAVAAAVIGLAGAYGYLYATSAPVRRDINAIASAARDQLTPAFERLKAFVTGQVAPAFKSGLIGALGEVKTFLINGLIPGIRGLYENYLPKLEKAWKTITGAFKENKTEIMTLVGWLRTAATWIAAHVLPVVGTLAGFLINVLAEHIRRTIRWIGAFVDTIHWIGGAMVATKNAIVAAWNAVASFLSTTFSKIKSWVVGAGNAISSAFKTVGNVASAVWGRIWGVIGPIVNKIVSVVRFGLNIVRQIFSVIFTWVGQFVSTRIAAVKSIVSSVLSAMSTVISTILNGIRNFFASAWAWIDQVTGGRLTAIKNFVVTTIGNIRDGIGIVLNAIRNIWNAAWSWLQTTAGNVWDGIKSRTSAAIETVKSVISAGMGIVRGVFDTVTGAIRGAWDTFWGWIGSTTSTWIDRIKSTVGSIKDHIVGVFHGIPRAIVSGINGMIGLVNGAIGTVNKILPRALEIPKLGTVSVPQGFATGGLIRGPGTGTSDSIPIMASDKEFMINAGSTAGLIRDFGMGFLGWLNSYRGVTVSGDPSAAVIRRGYADGGLITKTQSWIMRQDPKPYVFGAAGPDAWDCSSLVGGVWALLTGKNPNRRYFLTYDLPRAGGFVPGHGLYTIGLSREHVVGNLGGLAFEAANSQAGILTGAAATSVDRMPAQYYLPQMGNAFIPAGSGAGGSGFSLSGLVSKTVDEAFGPIRSRLPKPGGLADAVITGMFDKVASGIKKLDFDEGGALPPGPSVVNNGTRRFEQVLSPEQIDRLAGAAGPATTINVAPGAITITARDLAELKTVHEFFAQLPRLAKAGGARAATAGRT
jgi:phage-related protein